MTALAEKLNKYEVNCDFTKEGINLQACPQDGSLFDSTGENPADKNFITFLDELDSYKSYVDYDPRNRDIGLVVYVKTEGEEAWYNKDECEWIAC